MIRIKNKNEIDGIRKSCHLLTDILDELVSEVHPGVTTAELNSKAEQLIADAGSEPAFRKYGGFPTALCASVNNVVIHGVPNNRPLNEGDIVGLDLGVTLNGYFSDKAITVAVGKIDAATAKLLKDTEESLYRGIGAVSVSGRIKDIGKAVSEYLKPLGYGVVYEYCGHGVGLDVHEEPPISNNYPSHGPNPRFHNGMVLAIEPMVNMGVPEVKVDKADGWSVLTADGKKSAHFEHTIAIFNDQVEILTKK
jgi:methionyl aminopeptidase